MCLPNKITPINYIYLTVNYCSSKYSHFLCKSFILLCWWGLTWFRKACKDSTLNPRWTSLGNDVKLRGSRRPSEVFLYFLLRCALSTFFFFLRSPGPSSFVKLIAPKTTEASITRTFHYRPSGTHTASALNYKWGATRVGSWNKWIRHWLPG